MIFSTPFNRFTLSLLWVIALSTQTLWSFQSFAQDDPEISVLSETETAYSGALLMSNGTNIQLGALTEGRYDDLEDRERYLFWQGDSLFLGVIDTVDNNRLDVVAEFYWFESSLPRNSDFYVIVLKVTAAPSANTEWRIATPPSITDSLLFRDIGSVHRVEAAVDRSGDFGAIRWDWSVPFQNYRWEPERVIEVEQEYAAGAHLEGSAMRDLSGGTNVQAKGFLDAQTRVSTRYTITLWRWEMLVQAGATDMDWALVALSPEHEQDPAYHEYFLVLQAERNVPVRLDYLQFGTTFRKRALLLDEFSDLSIRLQDIQLTAPQNPCAEGFQVEGAECVPSCPENFEWVDDQCLPICPEGYELIDSLCREVCPPEYERQDLECIRICPAGEINIENFCEAICEDGTISTGGICQEEVCPDGYRFSDDRCLPICDEGQIWVDQECIPDCAQAGMVYNGMDCICPEGTELINERCVPQCQPGTQFNGMSCEPLCDEDERLVNGVCEEVNSEGETSSEGEGEVNSEEERECAEGQVWRDEQCLSVCPDGYLWEDGQCEVSCLIGYVIQNGRCVPENCPANSRLIDGICVACPAETTLVGETCQSCDPNVENCVAAQIKEDGGCAIESHQPIRLPLLWLLICIACWRRAHHERSSGLYNEQDLANRTQRTRLVY